MPTGIRIYWQPSEDPDVAKYEIYASPSKDGPSTLLLEVPHQIPGPNWQTSSLRFFYDHLAGDKTYWYQIVPVATSGVALPESGLFQPDGPVGAGLPTRVKIDHNYPDPDALRFVTDGGLPVPQGMIRVYTRADYEAGQTDKPLYSVETREDGRWIRPVYVEPGMDYVVVGEKPYAYASEPVVITV